VHALRFHVNPLLLPFPNPSITAETAETFSVTSAPMEELLLLPMRMLSQLEFVTDAWYVLKIYPLFNCYCFTNPYIHLLTFGSDIDFLFISSFFNLFALVSFINGITCMLVRCWESSNWIAHMDMIAVHNSSFSFQQVFFCCLLVVKEHWGVLQDSKSLRFLCLLSIENMPSHIVNLSCIFFLQSNMLLYKILKWWSWGSLGSKGC
jgi:hypothetical protein